MRIKTKIIVKKSGEPWRTCVASKSLSSLAIAIFVVLHSNECLAMNREGFQFPVSFFESSKPVTMSEEKNRG